MKKFLALAVLAATLIPSAVGAITIEELNRITQENFEIARKVQNGELTLPNAGTVQSSSTASAPAPGAPAAQNTQYRIYSPTWQFTGRVYNGRIYTPDWKFVGRIQGGRR